MGETIHKIAGMKESLRKDANKLQVEAKKLQDKARFFQAEAKVLQEAEETVEAMKNDHAAKAWRMRPQPAAQQAALKISESYFRQQLQKLNATANGFQSPERRRLNTRIERFSANPSGA